MVSRRYNLQVAEGMVDAEFTEFEADDIPQNLKVSLAYRFPSNRHLVYGFCTLTQRAGFQQPARAQYWHQLAQTHFIMSP